MVGLVARGGDERQGLWTIIAGEKGEVLPSLSVAVAATLGPDGRL